MLLIALAAWHMNKTHYLLVLPALAAAAGALAWSGAGGHQLITWAQTVSGDNHTRVTSVLLLGGDRQGSNEITLGPDIQLSNIIGETQASSIRYQDNGRQRVLSAYTHLLTPHACQLVSVSRYSPPFSLTLKHGHPQVILQAAAFPAKTRLLWRGHAYSVPSLTKGRTWQPTEAIGNLPASPAEKLLNRRLAFDEPALLLPFGAETADNSEPDTQTTGWLVIRHDSGRV
jgi:hypothetical protein